MVIVFNKDDRRAYHPLVFYFRLKLRLREGVKRFEKVELLIRREGK